MSLENDLLYGTYRGKPLQNDSFPPRNGCERCSLIEFDTQQRFCGNCGRDLRATLDLRKPVTYDERSRKYTLFTSSGSELRITEEEIDRVYPPGTSAEVRLCVRTAEIASPTRIAAEGIRAFGRALQNHTNVILLDGWKKTGIDITEKEDPTPIKSETRRTIIGIVGGLFRRVGSLLGLSRR